MNKYDLFRALTEIDDDLLAEAEQQPQKKKRLQYWKPLLVSCACLAVILLALWTLPKTEQTSSDAALSGEAPWSSAAPNAADASSAETSAQLQISASDTTEAILERAETSASTNAAMSYGSYPADFAFILTWPDGSYDSAAGILTTASGQIISRPLTQEQLQQAWNLLSGLEMTEGGQGELTLTLTQGGVTQTISVAEDDYGPALSIYTELIQLVAGAVE